MWWDYTYKNCLQFDLNQNSLMSIRKWNKGNTWGCMNCVQHTFSIHISLVILFYFPSLLSKHFQCRHLTCRAWFALWLSSRNNYITCQFTEAHVFSATHGFSLNSKTICQLCLSRIVYRKTRMISFF